MSKVKAVSTSLRTKSNSDILADQLIAGAEDAGREVEHISLEESWNKVRKIVVIFIAFVMLMSVTSCGQTETAKESTTESQETEPVAITASENAEAVNIGSVATTETEDDEIESVQDNESNQEAETMVLTINGEQVSVEWEDNESVEALKNLVMTEPLAIRMSMYGGFEQVGSIGTSLPRNDVQTTTEAGDIVLYSGNQIVVFYGSNSWAYTRLGKVTDKSKTEMTELLGKGDVTVTFMIGK